MWIIRIHVSPKKPNVIITTEVEPKGQRYTATTSEMDIKGFPIIHHNTDNNRERGIMMYVDEMLDVNEIEFDTDYEESLWINIKLHKKAH